MLVNTHLISIRTYELCTDSNIIGALGGYELQSAQIFPSDPVFSREDIAELSLRMHDARLRGEDLPEEESEFDENEEYSDLITGTSVAVILPGHLGGSGKSIVFLHTHSN